MNKQIKALLKHVLIDEETIEKRVRELGEEITRDYQDEEAPLVLICILKGAVLFMTDLVKCIDLPNVQLDFMAVSSYGSGTVSTGDVRILKDLDRNIEGANVLLVEDIIDTGYTLKYLTENIAARGAKSVKIATLLNKEDRRVVDIHGDYVGFEIPDEFVVGYGLDYDEKYRNLPFVGTLKPEVYEK